MESLYNTGMYLVLQLRDRMKRNVLKHKFSGKIQDQLYYDIMKSSKERLWDNESEYICRQLKDDLGGKQ